MKLCKNCKKELIKRVDEKRYFFNKRNFCSKKCRNEFKIDKNN